MNPILTEALEAALGEARQETKAYLDKLDAFGRDMAERCLRRVVEIKADLLVCRDEDLRDVLTRDLEHNLNTLKLIVVKADLDAREAAGQLAERVIVRAVQIGLAALAA